MLLLVGPFQEGGADVGDESMEYRSVLQQLRIPSVIRPERHTSVVLRWTDELSCGGRRIQMAVSIWDAVHSHSVDRWALSGADVQAP